MKLIFRGDLPPEEDAAWRAALAGALAQRLPQAQWLGGADAGADPDPAVDAQADIAIVANPPPGSLRHATRLRLIQSLWAGVDRLLQDATLPAGVPLARMVDPAMTAAMVQTVLWAVTGLHRGFFAYAQRQRQAQWRVHHQRRADEVGVLLLGLGALGRAAAAALQQQGYRVAGWRRGSGPAGGDSGAPAGLRVWAGAAELPSALAQADVLVNLLPLTPDTRDLLDARCFAALPRGAGVVNLARGAHLVDADLLAALDAGHLRHAVLDVFRTEPLPAAHPFWRHPRVTVLPHAAALTDLRSAAAVVADNLAALHAGRAVAHLVDRSRGY